MITIPYNETLHQFYYNLKYIMNDTGDSRTSPLPLMNNPVLTISIVATYIYFVLHWGPKYMKSRQPYKLKYTIMLYNVVQIIINSLLFGRLVYLWSSYNWLCQPFDSSTSKETMMMVYTCYMYFLNKIMDLTDTVFFILRKKQNQVTFLHVWHHSAMVSFTWIGVKYLPNGHGTFFGLINTFVHILLYLYYLLAALGPKVQKYLWWKKYLTAVQLIQFGIVMIHQLLSLAPNCSYPAWTNIFIISNAVVFTILFGNFYKQNYKTKKEKST